MDNVHKSVELTTHLYQLHQKILPPLTFSDN